MAKGMKIILTVPPYAHFSELASRPAVESIRLNTTLPLKDSLEDVISRVKSQTDKPIWVDLKCRQLRIQDYYLKIVRDQEIHYIILNHKIELNTPTEVLINNGNFKGKIAKINRGKILVIPSSAERKTGLPLAGQGEIGIRPGMSVSIFDPSLIIHGYLTQKDKKYIEAAKKLDIHDYMLSFVEKEEDITDLLDLDKDARILAKIESPDGLNFIRDIYPKYKDKVNLITARGDLYLELDMPDQIIDASQQIIKADPNAVFASRMFESLIDVEEMPKCQDLFDVYCGMQMGYKRFLLGDDICMRRDSVNAALGLFDVLAEKYQGK